MLEIVPKKSSTETKKISGAEAGIAILVLFIVAAAAAASLTIVGGLKTQYSVRQFFPENHHLIESDLETRRKFFLDESQPVLVTLELKDGGDWLESARLARLAKATTNLRLIHGTTAAISLGTVPAASQSGDELNVGTLLSIKSESDRRERVSHDRFLNPLLVSDDARRTLVVVSLDTEITTEAMRGSIEEIRGHLTRALPEAKISIGGVPTIQTQLSALVKKELVMFMGLALVACSLTLLAVFASYWSVLIPFVPIIATNIFALAFMAGFGFSMTVLAVTIPILVSVDVLSLCIHTLLRWSEDEETPGRLQGASKVKRVFATMRSLLVPNLLTSLTTSFGFATLMITNVPVIREFGLAASVCILLSFTTTTLVLGPLFVLLPVPRVRRWVLSEAGWTTMVFQHTRKIVVGVAVLCVGMAIVGRNLHWSARLFDDLPDREEARITTEEIDRSLGGTIPFELIISQSGKEPWNEPQALRDLDGLLGRLRAAPEVGSIVALPDLLRMALGNPTAPVPESRKSIAETWFLISMSEASPLKNFLTADGAATRLGVRLRDMPADQLEKAMDKFVSEAQTAFPHATVTTGGMATTVHRLNNGLSSSLMEGFWHALLVITLLIACVFRSWRWTLLAILPNLVPAAVLIGILALAKTPIKPGVAIVFSIALGIAFNNTVYLMQRLRSLMKETGGSPDQAVIRTLRLEGNPCVIASLCLLAGFGIFLCSKFGINQTFGVYMLISLCFGLVGDLVFLPALIHWFPQILVSTEKGRQANLEAAPSLTDKVPDSSVATEEDMSLHPTRKPNSAAARTAASIAALLTALAPATPAKAATSSEANAILKKVEQGMNAKDEMALIKMKVIESNGSSKERELEIKRKSGGKHQVLVRLKAPSDVSGVALLSVYQGGSEDQWLYMPSQKKARRVVSGNKSQKFLDTEFSLEDFSASTYARFDNKVLKEERAPSASVMVIESKAKPGSDSTYSKILTWVDSTSYQVQKSEYFDQEGKLLKSMVFRDYKKFGNAWRAQTVEVRNMQTHRSTVLHVAGMKLNSGLSDREFTQSALEQED